MQFLTSVCIWKGEYTIEKTLLKAPPEKLLDPDAAAVGEIYIVTCCFLGKCIKMCRIDKLDFRNRALRKLNTKNFTFGNSTNYSRRNLNSFSIFL